MVEEYHYTTNSSQPFVSFGPLRLTKPFGPLDDKYHVTCQLSEKDPIFLGEVSMNAVTLPLLARKFLQAKTYKSGEIARLWFDLSRSYMIPGLQQLLEEKEIPNLAELSRARASWKWEIRFQGGRIEELEEGLNQLSALYPYLDIQSIGLGKIIIPSISSKKLYDLATVAGFSGKFIPTFNVMPHLRSIFYLPEVRSAEYDFRRIAGSPIKQVGAFQVCSLILPKDIEFLYSIIIVDPAVIDGSFLGVGLIYKFQLGDSDIRKHILLNLFALEHYLTYFKIYHRKQGNIRSDNPLASPYYQEYKKWFRAFFIIRKLYNELYNV